MEISEQTSERVVWTRDTSDKITLVKLGVAARWFVLQCVHGCEYHHDEADVVVSARWGIMSLWHPRSRLLRSVGADIGKL
jgi:hypothetical protein